MGLREQRVPAVSKSISRARFQRAVMLLNLSQHPLVRFFLVCKGLETLLCPRWLLLCPGSARVAWSRVLAACSVGAAADGEQGVTRRERDPCCPWCLSQGCFAEFDFTKSFPSTSAPCLAGDGAFPSSPPREEDAVSCWAGRLVLLLSSSSSPRAALPPSACARSSAPVQTAACPLVHAFLADLS